MFEPVLDHNRKEYDRLHRYQILTVVSALPGFLVIGLLVMLLGDGRWVGSAILPFTITGFVVMGILELRKMFVFRRDRHEQRKAIGACDQAATENGNNAMTYPHFHNFYG